MAPRNRSKTLAETKSRKVATREPQNDRPAVPHVVSVLPINPPAIPGRRHPVKRGQPRAQLELTSTPLYRDNVHVIRGFLQSAECAAWIRWAEAVGFTEARHAASREVAFRDNGRVEVWEPAVAANIWERLREMVPAELDGWRSYGCFEKIRVYRYLQGGQRFGKHVDESCPGSVAGTKTSLTVLIYLNGVERDDNANMHGADDGGGGQPLKGGETVCRHSGSFSFHPVASYISTLRLRNVTDLEVLCFR